MTIDTISFKGREYPKFQAEGNAAQFVIPFAKYFCKGEGYDIGCNREEWKFPGSRPIDIVFGDGFDAYNLPEGMVDYIFSSHCLEHLVDWVGALDVWSDKIKEGGSLFLYLPDYSQEYWRPWNNRKHKNIIRPEDIKDYLEDREYKKVFVSGTDLNNSFAVVAER